MALQQLFQYLYFISFIFSHFQILRSLAYIHFSGLVLWMTKSENKELQKQIEQDYNKIIDYGIIENRIQQPVKYNNNNYFFQIVKELELIIVCSIPLTIKLANIDEILSGLLFSFIKEYESSIRSCTVNYDINDYSDFNKIYDQTLINLVKNGQLNEIQKQENKEQQQNEQKSQQESQISQQQPINSQQSQEEPQQSAAERMAKLKEQMRNNNNKQKNTKLQNIKKMKDEQQEQKQASLHIEKQKQQKKEESEEVLVNEDNSNNNQEQDLFISNAKSLKQLLSESKKPEQQSIFNIFKGKEISEQDFQQFSIQMQNILTGQNVSQEVAQNILKQVQFQFEQNDNYKTKKNIQQSLKQQISKILKSDSSNLMESIQKHVDQKRAGLVASPYKLCVVGINGMGKTTTIGKITYMLKQQKIQPFLVAADSFRSGAIEQLKTHAQRLQVGFYEQGYGKVPSSIAKYGIIEATKQDADVCLIDTAGRMQNNAKLMQELVTLIKENNPDKILFVGEALIGSTGVEQLKEFNSKIFQSCNRGIDGIILTKYDAVGNKVGSALNYCYVSGLPIYFVGIGQAYPDLVALDIEDVVDSLIC